MQSNVDIILTAARDTGLFGLVTDNAPHEIEDRQLPALIVHRRELVEIEPITTDLKRYNGRWEYHVWIESAYAKGHAVAENLLLRFLIQLHGDQSDPWFELLDRIVIDEGYHGQRQIIGAEFRLGILSCYDLEIV
jgi:hypothetical protein